MHRVRVRLALPVVVLLVLALMAGGCTKAEPEQKTSKEPIVVGMVTQLTGSGTEMGINLRDGFMLAIDEYNEAGGADGRKVEVRIRDTQANPTVGITVTQDLVYKENVTAVVGCANSPVIMADMAVTEEAKCPQLAFGMSAAILQQNNPYIFRVTPGDAIMAKNIVKYVTEDLKATKVAIIHDSTDYGKGGKDNVVAELKAVGLDPVTVQSFDVGDVDYSAQLLNVQKAAPEVMVMWSLYVEGSQILRQAKNVGLEVTTICSSGVLQGPFIDLAGAAAEGVLVTTYFASDDPDPETQKMIKAYKDRYGKDPDPVAATAYDTGKLLISAWESGTGFDRESLTKYLSELEYFRGSVAEFWIGETKGQLNQFSVLLEVKDAKMVTIWSSKGKTKTQ